MSSRQQHCNWFCYKAMALFLLMQITGCGTTQPTAGSTTAKPADEKGTVSIKLPAGESLVEVNQRIERAINEGDTQALFAHIDIQGITAKANKTMKALYGQEVIKADRVKSLIGSIENDLRNHVNNQGRWKFVGTMEGTAINSYSNSLIRIDQEDGGKDYLGLQITVDGDQFVVEDMHRFHLSMGLAKTLEHVYSYLFRVTQYYRFAIFEGKEESTKKRNEVLLLIKEFNTHASVRDYQKLKQTYLKLPDAFKNDILLLAALLAAGKNDDNNYNDALTLLAQYYKSKIPKLEMVDYYIYQKEYDKALELVDDFEQLIGQDAGLDLIRAGLYSLDQQFERSLQFCKRALEREPDYIDAYDMLYDDFRRLKRHDDMVLVLELMQAKFGYQYDRQTFESDPDYQAFVKSVAYQNWIKTIAQ